MQLLILIVLIVLILFVCIIIYDTNHFVVRKYRFLNDKIADTFRFVLISDLHNKSYGKGNERLLNTISQLKPDAVLCAGDMLTAKPRRDFKVAVEFMSRLALDYPVYYGNGNHEYRLKLYPETYGNMAEEYGEELKHAGIEPLVNQGKEISEKNIVIYGLEIGREYYKRFQKRKMEPEYIPSLLGQVDGHVCSILLAHNPEYFSQYADYGVDFVLSGHVHGGVARIPLLGGVISPSLHIFPKYDGGVFRTENKKGGSTVMILSRGLGTHTIPVRFLNPGELIEITISPKE
ncbi:MAG: hypothetical protein HDT13_07410 [Butyrivibrio sp.]|nr:hypothetical protein [Butyrivibrio sp.]